MTSSGSGSGVAYTSLAGDASNESKSPLPSAAISGHDGNGAIAGSSVDPALTNNRCCKFDSLIQLLVFVYPPVVLSLIVGIAYQARSQSSINGFSLALGFITLCALVTFGIMRMKDARSRTRMWSVITWSALVACGCSVPWGMGWQGFWFYDSLDSATDIPLASVANWPNVVAFHWSHTNVSVVSKWEHYRYFNETYTTPDGTIVNKVHKTYVVPLFDPSVADAIDHNTVGQWLVNEDGALPMNHTEVMVTMRANPDDIHMYYETIREAATLYSLTLPPTNIMAFLRNKDPNERLNYYTLLIVGGAAAALPIYISMLLSLWCCTPPPSNSFKSKYT